jgi:Ca2+-binding RTX toxin-like protein
VQPLWETAGGSEPTGSEAGAKGTISNSMLAPIVEEAKLRWTETLGTGDSRLAVLNSVNVQVGNLPEDRLGVTLGHDIYIDSDAAGRGWQTMDLASVVMHELGHVLGFDHDDAGAIPVMNGTLDAGAHIAQQVIDQQSSDASIVTPAAKSALTDGLGFSTSWIVLRAISLLDYTVGAADVTGAAGGSDYKRPFNPGNALAYGGRYAGEFGAYQEFAPMVRIVLPGNRLYFSNFDAGEGPAAGTNGAGASVYSDGNDRLFGDLGNDWIVGGTGKDHAFGGWGDDLINMDDDQTTAGGLNNQPDTATSCEDVAYGGAGRDVLVGNTGGDRLIDWVGEFNSYLLVPFSPFGAGTVSGHLAPGIMEYLLKLSSADGADRTRAADAGIDPLPNGEPNGAW